jgi:FAD/FMN-containing dehydrogenase
VRQLNHHVEKDRWFFPLTMATEGVAGMAGCLSCQARGYQQQQRAIYDSIESITIADGEGQILEVPSPVVCGAEGLWGAILEMKIQLKKLPHILQQFIFEGSWHDILSQLPSLLSLCSLIFVIYSKDKFYLGLETEGWRLKGVATFLSQCLPKIKILDVKQTLKPFLPSRKPFVVISSAFTSSQLPEACELSLDQAKYLQCECFQQAEVLGGSLHLILQSQESSYTFAQKIEKFLVFWTDFIDRRQGMLGSCHGVGMQMQPYMTPFWTEETQQLLRKFQRTFDPKGLFGKERFFPTLGKSLEKVRRNE